MPDRSLRLHPLPPGPFASGSPCGASPRGEGHAAPLLREHRPAPPQEYQHETDGGTSEESHGADGSGGPRGSDGIDGIDGIDGADEKGGSDSAQGPGGRDGNPYAPPPEGTPDRPWRPRHRAGGSGSGPGEGSGAGGGRSPWGSQWSDQQPGRSKGGFGDRPRGQGGPEGPRGQGDGGMRWDPSDPAQRRARYALLSGMWAFFFSLFGWRDLALLLGALALYWGISSLRAKPHRPDPTAPSAATAPGGTGGTPGSGSGPGPGAGSGAKPQTTAAVSGLVTASLALVMVAITFTAQVVYSDYYTCVNDSLTTSAKHSCDRLLPQDLRTVLGTQP